MFSGEIPDIFGNFTQLASLRIGGNQFFGRIPTSIRSCQQLNTLDLAANMLNASIPKEIYGLSTLVRLNLRQNALSGPLPAEVGNLIHMQFMDVSDNQLSGNIASTIGSCSSLQRLFMAGNNFTGSIPSTIGQLAYLKALDLSSNRLTGTIPEELGQLQYLVQLNLSFNHLEGAVPMTGVFMNISQDNLKGNDRLCHDNQTTAEKLGLPQCIAKRRTRHLLLKVILPVAIVACLMIMFLCFACKVIYWKKQKTKRGKGRLSSPSKGLPPKISYSDIRLATDNFSMENLIGKGGFGSVYKGVIRNVEDGSCTEKPSLLIDHNGEEFKALVMEFMSHGNLDKWLYQEDDEESGLYLTLSQRLNIAVDVASAIDYLHHDCDPPVVHCDLKPGNVLLDDDMVAHVGDFGLARLLPQNPSGNDSSTIGLKGSIGYIAPEYGLGGKPSTSGDVYSFGILLLEMFIAKKPTNEMFKEGLSLNNFATAVNENHVMEIADPRLFKNNWDNSLQRTDIGYSNDGSSGNSNTSSGSTIYSLDKSRELVAAAIRVGLSCAASSARDRLSMREALAMLEKIKKAMPQTNKLY
ncbi:probable LRR receptor-like serine/threonine-protein kinase At3g47570 [Hevea brasiliensis]|uniref:probable LRR receptor-like serine/threonine-protein kinase At3g47570 n=1 Tax=Hevea brasiliensis TaxID=3981 RepID=UPI0025FD8817|nr:probable LRR receptor-like serine/threonine-protein kinase At3g47570 [Hevea brasiliensis]